MTRQRPMGPNRYGKSGIRLAVVARDLRTDPPTHDVTDLEVDVRLAGDFDAAHVDGDNAAVLPTDTMRGTCLALARDGVPSAAGYARRLAERFLEASAAATHAWVRVTTHPWRRLAIPTPGHPTPGHPTPTDPTAIPDAHPHTFTPAGGGLRWVEVRLARHGDAALVGGAAGMRVAKTTGSAFSGFLRDAYTTLGETRDRIMATTVEAAWGIAPQAIDGGPAVADRLDPIADDLATVVPATALAAFADHDASESVQHTLHHMGWAVLDAHPSVPWIRFRMPNEHHVLADLSPYGLDNPGEVFVVTDRPFGVIEGAVARDGVTPEVPWEHGG